MSSTPTSGADDHAITAMHHVGRLAHAATLAAIARLAGAPTIDDIEEAVTVLTVALEGVDPDSLVQLVTVDEAAAIIGMSASGVRSAIQFGRLAYAREDNQRRKWLARAAVVAYRDRLAPRGGRPRTPPTPLEDQEHRK